MNILESRPGQGTFLSKDAIRYILSAELIEDGYRDASLFEITEIRALLEAQSAYWAAERATDEDMEELKNIAEGLVTALEDRDEEGVRSLMESLMEKWEEVE